MSASKFSFKNKLLSKSEFESIESHINKLGLPNKISKFFSVKKINRIIYFMQRDKKNNSNRINLVLLHKIGKPSFNLNFNTKKISTFIKKELIN